MSSFKITVFGSARMDIFALLPEGSVEAECRIDRKRCVIELGYGEKIPLAGVEYCVGGNGANVAVGMNKLSVPAYLVCEVGSGIMGDKTREELEGVGIELSGVSQSVGVPAGVGIVINYQEERTILSYYPPFRPQFPDSLPATQWAYLTSIGENFEEYYAKALSWVRNGGVRLAFNPGGRQIKKGREWMGQYLRYTEILLVNLEEACALLEQGEKNYSSGAPDIEKLMGEISRMGPKVVVITDGPAGAYVGNGQTFLHMPIVQSPVVERTGAGDAFSSGFLAGIVSGKDMEEALLWGTLNSASVIGKVGPQAGLLGRKEMDERAKKE